MARRRHRKQSCLYRLFHMMHQLCAQPAIFIPSRCACPEDESTSEQILSDAYLEAQRDIHTLLVAERPRGYVLQREWNGSDVAL